MTTKENPSMDPRWAEQVAFERNMEAEGGSGCCDSCWMLPQVHDALIAAARRAEELAPTELEVEAWVAGYLAGREDDQWRTEDEIAERAVDAACAVRVDAKARATLAAEGAPR